MKRIFKKHKLQRKILFTVLSLSVFTVLMIVLLITYIDYKQTFENKEDLSLQTSKALSYMEETRRSLQYEFDIENLHSLITNIQTQVDAGFVYVMDGEGKIIGHTNSRLREYEKGVTSEFQAIVFGGSYNVIDEVFGERGVLGISPVFVKEEQVIGTVVVGYLVEDIYKELFNQAILVFKIAAIILAIGGIVSFLLAKNIRKDTYGMEPAEIALLYKDRNAILSSMGEGLIAIDNKGNISLMNVVAKRILNVNEHYIGTHIDSLIAEVSKEEIYLRKNQLGRYEINLNNIPVIIRSVPLENQSGHVITIVDTSELKEVTNALKEVKMYSDDLRAQTHEFSNKLHVILGFIQLSEYRKVEQMIKEEVSLNEYSNQIIFNQIEDLNVQAILLGKISKATEKKVEFIIDETSNLGSVSSFIKTNHLTTIIGNLIDNAIEAVQFSKNKKITFFAMDYGTDIVFEVSDEGGKINESFIDQLFEKGFSTKESVSRGFGLMNVASVLEEIAGSIEVHSDDIETIFAVYIPKKMGGNN